MALVNPRDKKDEDRDDESEYNSGAFGPCHSELNSLRPRLCSVRIGHIQRLANGSLHLSSRVCFSSAQIAMFLPALFASCLQDCDDSKADWVICLQPSTLLSLALRRVRYCKKPGFLMTLNWTREDVNRSDANLSKCTFFPICVRRLSPARRSSITAVACQ